VTLLKQKWFGENKAEDLLSFFFWFTTEQLSSYFLPTSFPYIYTHQSYQKEINTVEIAVQTQTKNRVM
jgi:hypothetical protein